MRPLVALLAVAFSTCGMPAGAGEPIEIIPDGPDRIVPLALGEPAPFSGQLYDPDTALRWANWLEQYRLRLTLEVNFQRNICTIKTAYGDARLDIERERATRAEAALEASLRRRERELDLALNPPWYRTTWFGVAAGTAGTLAVTALAAWAVSGP